MKPELRKFLANPPAGSAARRALEFGIDLSLTYRNMFERTMEQRWATLDERLSEAANRSPARPRSIGKIPN